MDGLIGLIVIAVVALAVVMGIRHRRAIAIYMRVTYAYDLDGERRKVLLKRKIEDAEAELEHINEEGVG